MNFGDPSVGLDPKVVDPMPSIPPACDPSAGNCAPGALDGLPEVELFDIDAQAGSPAAPRGRDALRRQGPGAVRRPGDRARVLFRFVNDRNDGIGFPLDVSITGDVE